MEYQVFTIGHSTQPLPVFIHTLKENGVSVLFDVRTIPRSRANPQYEQASLREALKQEGIVYVHYPCLGGLRRPRKDSPNTGWVNPSFRGYADYMLTEEFERCLRGLLEELAARGGVAALMCAEAVPWRCHRSLIADALLVRGIPVTHLVGGRRRPHALTRFAVVDGTRITYPEHREG